MWAASAVHSERLFASKNMHVEGKGVMRLANFDIKLMPHAFERYCQRVEQIDRAELERVIREQLKLGCRRDRGYLQTQDEVWWRISVSNSAVTFHSCYGRTSIDIPKAVKWAKRNKDRIALGVGARGL